MAAIGQLPEVIDVSTNLESRSPRVDLVIDRDKAAAVGLNASTIANALGTGLGPRWATTIYGQRSQYRVLLELDSEVSAAGRHARRRSRSRRRTATWSRSSRS